MSFGSPPGSPPGGNGDGPFGPPPGGNPFDAPLDAGGAGTSASPSGAFGPPPGGSGPFGGPTTTGAGGFGAPPTSGGAFGAPPTSGGAFGAPATPQRAGIGKIIGIIAAIVVVLFGCVCGIGFYSVRRAQERAEEFRERIRRDNERYRLQAQQREMQAAMARAQAGSQPGQYNTYSGGTTTMYGSSTPTVIGLMPVSTVTRVVQQNMPMLRRCYEPWLTTYPTLQGRVTLQFMIGSTGRVISSSVTENLPGQPAVGTCMAGVARAMLFPRPVRGLVTVTYPIMLTPSGT